MSENTDGPRPIATKDRNTIHAMRVCNHVPTCISPEMVEGKPVMMYHFDTCAWTDYDDYMRGVEREPFITIRRYEAAEREFKNNMHRFIRS